MRAVTETALGRGFVLEKVPRIATGTMPLPGGVGKALHVAPRSAHRRAVDRICVQHKTAFVEVRHALTGERR